MDVLSEITGQLPNFRTAEQDYSVGKELRIRSITIATSALLASNSPRVDSENVYSNDRDGSFRFSDVIPGDYLLIVWPRSRSWEGSFGLDPEAFAILEQRAARVHIDRAGVVQKNVQLTEEVRSLLERLLE